MALGICDWGIGGIGLYQGLRRLRPDLDIVYLSDQGYETYSLLSREALMARVEHVLHTFSSMGVRRVVMACGSASTTLSDVSVPGVSATGVIAPVLRSMKQRRYREVGVIGGRRTILSGAFGRALRKQRFMVVQRVSLDLSQRIEAGLEDEPETTETIRALLEPLAKVDGLLLACTHYPLVIPTIQSMLPNAEIIDPVQDTVLELAADLPRNGEHGGRELFYTSGDPSAMKQRVRERFGLKIDARPFQVASRISVI